MSGPSAGQSGGMLAAPAPGQRRGGIAAIAGAALATILAAVALIIAIHRSSPPIYRSPPRGLVATLSGPGGQAICSAAFSPDGTTLAVAECNDSVSLWDVATRRWIATLASTRCPDGGQVVFSPEGKTLALFSGRDPTTCLWDVATRRETTLTDPGPRPDPSYDMTRGAFSPSGTTLAVADANRNIYLWDLATRRVVTTVPVSRDCGPICPVAFSPDGTMLAVGESDGSGAHIYLWNTTAKRWTATLTDPGNTVLGSGVNSVTFSPDGILAVGDSHDRASLWDVTPRRLTATFTPPVNAAAGNASISKGAGDGGPYPAPGAFDQAVTAALSPDGTTLAAGVGFGYGTYLYDVATGERFATLTDPGGDNARAPALALSPDGKMVAVTDANGRTYLWLLPDLHSAH
jgi:WD40 repeat protein